MKTIYLAQNDIYIYENDRVVKSELKPVKGAVTSSIGYKDIINITFKLPKTVEKDMLEIEAEKYVFTEASLDYQKEYKINYIFREYEDYYNVEAFVVETNVLKQKFEKYLKVFKHIDFISASPFVFKSYYDITNTPPKNDVFICFNEEEAYLSCFENGEFVYVKGLSKLSALSSQLNLDKQQTVELLSEKGLDETKYEDSQVYSVVESFFSQLFMKVNNLINYSISYYSLTQIDRIYFYSPFKIHNLFESYTGFWDLSGIEFKEYKIQTDYDYFDYTALIYNAKHYENENENFSIFPKPVPFYRKKSGIFILTAVVVFMIIGADAFYKYKIISQQESEIAKLNKKISRLKKEHKLVQAAVKKYSKKVADLKAQNKALQQQIADLADKINRLYEIQRSPLVANDMAFVVSVMKKYGLKLSSYSKSGSHTDLLIVSEFDNSSTIAEFLKDLYKHGYKNVSSSNIDNNLGIYISKVSYDE